MKYFFFVLLLSFLTRPLLAARSYTTQWISDFKTISQKIYPDKTIIINILKQQKLVNVSTKEGSDINIYLSQGFLDLKELDQDTLILFLCHELGHHYGGLPKSIIKDRRREQILDFSWGSSEGQADFWGAKKCMRQVVKLQKRMAKEFMPECLHDFSNEDEVNTCSRVYISGIHFTEIINKTKSESESLSPYFIRLVPVSRGLYKNDYPSLQCRLNTFIAAALNQSRPSCWYLK